MPTVVFSFGRMNPPTSGHSKVVDKVVETARSLDADHVIFLSQTCDSKNNPLDWNFKKRVCESAFPGVYISNDKEIKNPFLGLQLLAEQYDKVILVCGSDQVDDFEQFRKYTDVWGTEFEVMSAGERVNESRGVAGISASKMRQYAREGKMEKFMEGLPKTINSNVKEMVYNKTRKGLK